MSKFALAFPFIFLFFLSACTPVEPIEATRPVVTPTTVPTQPATPAATSIATATATAGTIEEIAVTEPAVTDLETFIEGLETAVTNQQYAAMLTMMSENMVVGAFGTEWQNSNPAQTIQHFQNGSLPSPLAVQFTHLSPEEITNLIGQPPATLVGSEVNVVTALHSTGWGQSTSDEAVLLVAEEDGRYTWHGFLYTNGRFADANMPTAVAPAGLIYITYGEGVYQVQSDNQRRQLLNAEQASTPNIRISPDGLRAAYLNDARQLWLIDTITGEQERLGSGFDFSYFLMWGDNTTLFTGVWLDPNEADGPNNGHLTTVNVVSHEVQILDEEHLFSNRPALAPDGQTIAFDAIVNNPGSNISSFLYHPETGIQFFAPSTFTAQNEIFDASLFNPSWSPNGDKITWLSSTGERVGLQVFDLENRAALQIFDWDPARFGGLIPSPVWSPDGQWLALDVLANGPEGSGIWLLAADGSSQTLVDAQGHEPHWVSASQLVFGVNDGPRLYDVNGETFKIDVPDGSWVLGMTDDTMPVSTSAPAEDLPDPADLAMTVEQEASPDGRWQAIAAQSEPVLIGDLEKLYVSLTVTDGTTTWTPVAEWRGYGLGYIWSAVYRWSADSRYLYYTNVGAADGCLFYSNGTDLYRLDVTDGSVTEILPDGKTGNLSLSADESALAYTSYNGSFVSFVLRDVATGTEQSVAITDSGEYAQTGQIFWSADGNTAVLTLVYDACNPAETHSIVRIDLGDRTTTTLIAKDEHVFRILDWPDPNQPEIRLLDNEGNTWWLEINSGELALEE